MKTFIKLALVSTAVVALSACGSADRFVASATGHAKSCVDGVSYLQFTSGATVQVDRNGKPVPC